MTFYNLVFRKEIMTFKQSEHDKKFDRQMRLWGAHGQINLENANICMLGSGALASEILKNLVLPNIGKFTVIDDAKVSDADLGNNFFVTQDDIGKSRADSVKTWLLEMNSDVKGVSINKNIDELITSDIKSFGGYTFVISTNLYGKNDLKVAKFCYDNDIPYLSVKINGLMGKMRLQLNELTIMESHPTNDRTDLCIYPDRIKLFKSLYKYAKSYDIKTTDVERKAHLPCVALLVQFTENWIKDVMLIIYIKIYYIKCILLLQYIIYLYRKVHYQQNSSKKKSLRIQLVHWVKVKTLKMQLSMLLNVI